MTAYAITGQRCHREDRIHFMGGRHGRRRGRPFGPGYAFGRRAGLTTCVAQAAVTPRASGISSHLRRPRTATSDAGLDLNAPLDAE